MFHLPTFRIALLAAALSVPAVAQVQVFGGNAPRMASTRIFFQNGPVGMVCVQYGQPEWKDEYDAMADKLKGKRMRLGKDFWTTLNTSVPLTVGATKVAPGSYYLGLECDAEGGFHLLVLRAENSDKQGWAPFMPDAWKPDYACAMEKGVSQSSATRMTMDLASDAKDPANMKFSINWGKHVLSVPVVAQLGGEKGGATPAAVEAASPTKDAKKK